MASFSTPTLTITPAPAPGQSVITVGYQIQFDARDRGTDQPYAETVALIGDDTNVPGDPQSAAPDDQLATLVSGSTVRASMNGGQATFARKHVQTIATATLNEDRAPVPNPDEIRALVTLAPQALPVAVSHESNLVTLTIADPTTVVPDVVGEPADDALHEIRDAGLVQQVTGPIPGGPALVKSQSPKGGTVVAIGSTVMVTWRRDLQQ